MTEKDNKQKVLDQLNKQKGLKIIGQIEEQTPIYILAIECEVVKEEKLNLLEEYILKGLVELVPQPSLEEFSDLLSLAIPFIQYGINSLIRQKLVRKVGRSYEVTEDGKQAYERGCYPAIESVELYLRYQPYNGALIPILSPQKYNDPVKETLDLNIDKETLNDKIISFYPDFREVVSIRKIKTVREDSKKYLAILIYDEYRLYHDNETELILYTYDLQTGQLDHDLKKDFEEKYLYESYPKIFGLRDFDMLLPNEDILLKSEISIPPNQKKFYVGDQVRTIFIETLKMTKNFAIIVSPWINEKAVDDELIEVFKQLAIRGAIIFIGWGISNSYEEEQKKPPVDLLNKLEEIRTQGGVPLVNVFWLGNTHSKDVIVDRRIALSGSYNYLSYNPKLEDNRVFRLRNESVNYFDEEDIQRVEQIYQHWSIKFTPAIDKFWDSLSLNGDHWEKRAKCIMAWCVMGQPLVALEKISQLALSYGSQIPQRNVTMLYRLLIYTYIKCEIGNTDLGQNLMKHIVPLAKNKYSWIDMEYTRKLWEHVNRK